MADDPKAQPNSAASGGTPDGQASGDPAASVGKTILTDPKAGEPAAKPGEPAAGDPAAAKPGDPKPGDEKGKKPAEGAPEKYETFTAPEGVTLDQELLGKFSTTAKELNLSQVGAQKLFDLAAENAKAIVAQQQEQARKTREGWVNELKADKEFGGEKFGATVLSAQRTLGKFGSPKLMADLEDSGFGDNAELIRLLTRVDKATREDTIVDGDPAGADPKSAAETIYPNQGKSKK